MNKQKSIVVFLFIIIASVIFGLFDYQPAWDKTRDIFGLSESLARPWRLGLDLVGGSSLIYEIDLSQVASEDQDSVVNGLRDVIERRVNLFGVAEPQVYLTEAAGVKRLVVDLAGVKDVNQAIREIGETPLLSFMEANIDDPQNPVFTPTALTGRYVTSARVELDQITGKPLVNLQFNDDGGKLFEELTGKNIGKYIGIFLDSTLIELPVVREKITGGRAQISGDFTVETARALVERFNAGALPAPISLVSQQTIGATLGENSLNKAVYAGIIGTLLVMLFMVIYYRGLGVYAAIALTIYVVLTLGIFKLVPVTMTLAGIAGFILSVGMAVDANILIFERIKEELKRGLVKTAAVEEGFRRAWTSIRDSNVTSIITALILYNFTSSFVKGFALALLLGVLMSMFSAINVTRNLLRVFMRNR